MSNLQNTYVIVDSLGRSIDVCPAMTSDNVHLYIPAERIRELIERERGYLNDKGVLAVLEALIEEPEA